MRSRAQEAVRAAGVALVACVAASLPASGADEPPGIVAARAVIAAHPQLSKRSYDALAEGPFLLAVEHAADAPDAPLNAKMVRRLAEHARVVRAATSRFVDVFGPALGTERPADLRTPDGGGAPRSSNGTPAPYVVFHYLDPARFFDVNHQASSSDGGGGYAGVGWIFRRRPGLTVRFMEPDEDRSDRSFGFGQTAGIVAVSLLRDVARQRGADTGHLPLPCFLEIGISEWFGGLRMSRERDVEIHGLNVARLRSWMAIRRSLNEANKRIWMPSLRESLRFEGLHEVQQTFVARARVDPGFATGLFYIRAGMFIRFLDDASNGTRRDRIPALADAFLGHPERAGQNAAATAGKVLGISTDAEWTALEREFERYVRRFDRMSTDSEPEPSALDDWPGYVAPRLEAPVRR